jgi:hypothetical protein
MGKLKHEMHVCEERDMHPSEHKDHVQTADPPST